MRRSNLRTEPLKKVEFPRQYSSSLDSEYRKFMKGLVDTINDLEQEAFRLRSNRTNELQINQAQNQYASVMTLMGQPTSSPQLDIGKILLETEEEKKINKKIKVMRDCLGSSYESNYKEKNIKLLDDLQALEDPLSRLRMNK
ncbi:MAG: hypothetical protein JSS53_08235 [Proteobacteria bacterium]|nr:hypothetical protein [Pseudomonadota bacterium]